MLIHVRNNHWILSKNKCNFDQKLPSWCTVLYREIEIHGLFMVNSYQKNAVIIFQHVCESRRQKPPPPPEANYQLQMQHSQEELLCSDFLKCKMRWEGRVLYTCYMWKNFLYFCDLINRTRGTQEIVFGAACRDKVSKLFSPWASCLVNKTLYHNILS